MTTQTTKKGKIQFTQINNDISGNPRFVVHFLNLLTENEQSQFKGLSAVSDMYNEAVNKAKKIGGKRYRAKQYGGGIVFGSIYDLEDLENKILNLNN